VVRGALLGLVAAVALTKLIVTPGDRGGTRARLAGTRRWRSPARACCSRCGQRGRLSRASCARAAGVLRAGSRS
jgi:hypothetical protein